jgi:hypothetical protein
MSEANGHITKQDLRDALDDAFTRFSQHVLHEVGVRFDEMDTRLESIDSRLKLQAGLIQSGALAMTRLGREDGGGLRWTKI